MLYRVLYVILSHDSYLFVSMVTYSVTLNVFVFFKSWWHKVCKKFGFSLLIFHSCSQISSATDINVNRIISII